MYIDTLSRCLSMYVRACCPQEQDSHWAHESNILVVLEEKVHNARVECAQELVVGRLGSSLIESRSPAEDGVPVCVCVCVCV